MSEYHTEIFGLESGAYGTRAGFSLLSILVTFLVITTGCCFRTACKGKVFLTYLIAICDFIIAIFWCIIALIGETFAANQNSFDASVVAITITVTVTALKFASYLLITTYCVNSAMKIREIYINQGREMGAGDQRKRYRQSRIRIWLAISIALPLIYGFVWLVLSLASFHDFENNHENLGYNISAGIFGFIVSIEKRPFALEWDLIWVDLQMVSVILVNIVLLIIVVFNIILYINVAYHIKRNRGLYLLEKRDYRLACLLALAKTLFILVEEISILISSIFYIFYSEHLSHTFEAEHELYVIFIITLIILSVIQGLQGGIHVLLYGVFKTGFTSAIKTFHKTPNFMRDRVIRANNHGTFRETEPLVDSVQRSYSS